MDILQTFKDTHQRALHVSLSLILALVALLALNFSISTAQNPEPGTPQGEANEAWNIVPVAQIGGPVQAVAAQGDLIYLGVGDRLEIYDPSDLSHPQQLGILQLPGIIRSLYVNGERLALTLADDDHLYWVDVNDPLEPRLTGQFLAAGSIIDVYLSAQAAYLAVNLEQSHPAGGLQIVAYADPSLAAGSWFTQTATYQEMGIYVQDNLAYLADGDLTILDISAPQNISLVTNYTGSHDFTDVVIQDVTAYLHFNLNRSYPSDYDTGGIVVADIADKQHINEIGEAGGWYGGKLIVRDQVAYYNGTLCLPRVGLCRGIFHRFNLTDPGNISSNEFDAPGAQLIADFDIYGGRAYLAANQAGLVVLDLSQPESLEALPDLFPPARIDRLVSVPGGLAFTNFDQLGTVNIDQPDQPYNQGTLNAQTGGWLSTLAEAGEHVYLLPHDDRSMLTVDLSDLTHPITVSEWTSQTFLNGLTIAGNYAYIATDPGLLVMDISNPAEPNPVSSLTFSPSYAVAISGDYAYMPLIYGGLGIVDIHDPFHPSLVKQMPFDWTATSLSISGNNAYALSSDGLLILDITHPTDPLVLTAFQPRNTYIRRFILQDRKLYIAAGEGGLRVMNISQPDHPFEEASYVAPGLVANDVAVVGDKIYVGSESNGLYVLQESFSLHGRATTWGSQALPGVQVSLSPTLTSQTDAQGVFAFTGLQPGTYTVTPTLSGLRFEPASFSINLPASNDWVGFQAVPAPLATLLQPATAGSLAYTDTQGLKTSLTFPAGVVISATHVVVTPTLVAAPPGMVFSGHAFELSGLPAELQVPISVTIAYSDLDIRTSRDERQLSLMQWDGRAWQEARQTCNPPGQIQQDLVENRLSVQVCLPSGKLALLAPSYKDYFPLLRLDQ